MNTESKKPTQQTNPITPEVVQHDDDGVVHEPIRTEPLGGALVKHIDVQDQSAAGLALFKERAKVAKEQLKTALTLVQPGQFVVMTSTKDGKTTESIYATGGAADRILRMGFGMSWSHVTVRIERDEDANPVWAIARGTLLKSNGEPYEEFEGRRRMAGFVKTEADLIKGAKENMKHQAVTDIMGLRFLTPADLAELGLDVKALPRRADFQDRGPDEAGAATVPWGKKKGTAVTDLDEKDLEYYAGKARESIADPEKAKFAAKEKVWLKALEAEQARRKAPKAAPAGEELEKVLVRVRELGPTIGMTDTAIEAGIAKIETLDQAKAWLKKLEQKAAEAREPGSDDDQE